MSRGNKDTLISRGNKDILISRGNKLIKSDNKVIWRGNNKGFLLQTAFHTGCALRVSCNNTDITLVLVI